MKTIIYALYDRAVAVYGRPVFSPGWGALAREIKDEIVGNHAPGGGGHLRSHPEDFDVYELGAFEDTSADFQIYAKPLLVCNCSSFVDSPLGNRSPLPSTGAVDVSGE